MWKNYFLTAYRQLNRSRILTGINIIGLSLGLMGALLMFLWSKYERSFDQFHAKGDLINKVYQHMDLGDGKPMTMEGAPYVLGPDLLADYPEVADFTRIGPLENSIIGVHMGDPKEKRFVEKKGYVADANFFELFSFPVLEGNPVHLLQDPLNMVITSELATKYFGREDPIGQRVQFNNGESFTVTGVVEVPANSHLQFDFVIPVEYVKQYTDFYNEDYGNNNVLTYLLLNRETDHKALSDKIIATFTKGNIENIKSEFYLEKLTRVRLYGYNYPPRIYIIQALSIVAFLIVLVACINYISISTAQALRRSKEVGIRKIHGAARRQLVFQILTETFLLSLLALIMALIVLYLLLPNINELFEIQLTIDLLRPVNLLGFILICFLTSLVAGLYPAWVISRYQPLDAMHAVKTTTRKKPIIRRVLVTAQFIITIILTTTILVNTLQGRFMEELGFETEDIVYFPIQGELSSKFPEFKSILETHNGIEAVTKGNELPVRLFSGTINYGPTNDEVHELASVEYVDHDYLKTFQIDLKSGRFFSRDFPGDEKNSVVINEEAIGVLELKEPVVGQQIYRGSQRYTIIGVVQNYHFIPKVFELRPLLLHLRPEGGRYAFVKINSSVRSAKESIAVINAIHQSINPGQPLEFQYLNDFHFDEEKPMRIAENIMFFFMVFGIFISCMGLYGLTLYLSESKRHEIGVRKVMGASLANILGRFTREYFLLLIIANLIATPLAYLFTTGVLTTFAYTVRLDWWVFLITGIFLSIIALITVAAQSYKTARLNPAVALKSE